MNGERPLDGKEALIRTGELDEKIFGYLQGERSRRLYTVQHPRTKCTRIEPWLRRVLLDYSQYETWKPSKGKVLLGKASGYRRCPRVVREGLHVLEPSGSEEQRKALESDNMWSIAKRDCTLISRSSDVKTTTRSLNWKATPTFALSCQEG